MPVSISPYEVAINQLENAAKLINLESEILEILKKPQKNNNCKYTCLDG